MNNGGSITDTTMDDKFVAATGPGRPVERKVERILDAVLDSFGRWRHALHLEGVARSADVSKGTFIGICDNAKPCWKACPDRLQSEHGRPPARHEAAAAGLRSKLSSGMQFWVSERQIGRAHHAYRDCHGAGRRPGELSTGRTSGFVFRAAAA